MTTLENLWYGNIRPCEKAITCDNEYSRAAKLCIRHTDYKLIAAQTEQSSLGECDAFIRGFVLGVKIMQEVNRTEI